jgi:3'-phosphoadenosine 5'-phosphosulfate (PAPS) 3'-phosphatase
MIKAARKAGRKLVRDFGEVENLQVSIKGPGDFVSAADRKAEQIIRDELTGARPNYGWLGEESEPVAGIDPSTRPGAGSSIPLMELRIFCTACPIGAYRSGWSTRARSSLA